MVTVVALLLPIVLAPVSTAVAATPSPKPTAKALPTPAPAAGQNATFGLAPGSPSQVDSRQQFSYQMADAATYADSVLVTNYAVQPVDLTVYAADLGSSDAGDLAVPAGSVTPVDAGSWVKLGSARLSIHLAGRADASHSKILLPFTVKVPVDASPGDHSAAIVASLSTVGKNAKGENVQLDQRLATRVFIRVNGAVRGRLSIDDLAVSYSGTANPLGRGTAHVTYTLRNSGNVKIGARQSVNVTGLFGTSARGPVIPDHVLLLPGGTIKMSVDVTGVFPAFSEKVHVVATPLPVRGDPDPHAKVATRDRAFSAIPWPLIIAISVVLLLLTLLGVLWWRHRRRRPSAPPAGQSGGGPRPTSPDPDGSAATGSQTDQRVNS